MAQAEEEAGEPLVSMKRTAAENKAAQKRMETTIGAPRADYPYGLTLRLGKAELKKLGIYDNLPAVGDLLDLDAKAKVISVHEDAAEGREDSCEVELQITDLYCEPAADGKSSTRPKSTVQRKTY